MASPILDAITILRGAVSSALDALTDRPIYWAQAEGGTLPYVIVQSQDGGGRANPALNSVGWAGLVTVKALASTLPAAETLMAAIAPGMDSLTATGYVITTIYDRPVTLPPESGVWQSINTWRVIIDRSS